MGLNSAFKGLKLLKTPGNGRLNNLNDPVFNVLRSSRHAKNLPCQTSQCPRKPRSQLFEQWIRVFSVRYLKASDAHPCPPTHKDKRTRRTSAPYITYLYTNQESQEGSVIDTTSSTSINIYPYNSKTDIFHIRSLLLQNYGFVCSLYKIRN